MGDMTFLGAVGAILVGVAISHIAWWLQQRPAKKEERKKRRALLALFAWEAVHLQDRWVQYRVQANLKQISFSRPYEMTDNQLVAEILKLEPSDDLAAAIHVIKQLNSDVKTQIIRAQDEYSVSPTEPLMEGAWSAAHDRPFDTFRVASAFIDDDWEMAEQAIMTILNLATEAGADTKALKRNFIENGLEYQSVVKPKPPKKAA